jgi:hypothetical protein
MSNRKQWFIDRIGQRVYRNHVGCDCTICKGGYTHGIIISDPLSADYIWESESISNSEGDPLMYFDTIEQRDAFETFLKENSITYDGSIEKCVEVLVARIGIEDAPSIVLFQKIAKNYLNIQNIANEKSK